MAKIDDFYKGVKVALMLGNIEAVSDWVEIQKLNTKSTNAWERGNNSGNSEYLERMEKISDKAWEKAQDIASKNKWKLSSPGLYWEIEKDGYRI